MKLKMMGNCSAGYCKECNSSNRYRDNDDFSGEEECSSGGAVVVVGVKMDSRSNELLTWAMVKIAQSGDRVIALHVIDPNTGMFCKFPLNFLGKKFMCNSFVRSFVRVDIFVYWFFVFNDIFVDFGGR